MKLINRYILIISFLAACVGGQSVSAILVGGVLPYRYVPGYNVKGYGLVPWQTSDYKFLLIKKSNGIYSSFLWKFDCNHNELPSKVIEKLKQDCDLFNLDSLDEHIVYKDRSCSKDWEKDTEKTIFLVNVSDYIAKESQVIENWMRYYRKNVIIVTYKQLKEAWQSQKKSEGNPGAYLLDFNTIKSGGKITNDLRPVSIEFLEVLFAHELRNLQRLVEGSTDKPLKVAQQLVIDSPQGSF